MANKPLPSVAVMRCTRVTGFPVVAALCDTLETALAYTRTPEARIYAAHGYVMWIEARSFKRLDRRAWVRCGGTRGCGCVLRRAYKRCHNTACGQPREGWGVVADVVARTRRALGM